jgi:hypothetical protein
MLGEAEMDSSFANKIVSDDQPRFVDNKQWHPETLEEQEALALHLLET